MERFSKIVFEAEEGITFDVSTETKGKLIIKALKSDKDVVKCLANYVNPPIPDGYLYVCGEWNNGFVIERGYDGSQFVWIPVEWLDADGTLDGENFTEKFGRRNYQSVEFSDRSFSEPIEGELIDQIESVKKYGGFYISRYAISMGSEGKAQSVKGVIPWVNVNFFRALNIAASIENSEAVKSHLIFGAEYDSVLAWLIKSGAKTLHEIVEYCSDWGNYLWDIFDLNTSPIDVVETGSKEEWCVNNICDLAGNVDEWTQERNCGSKRVVRGGCANTPGDYYTVAYRYICKTKDYSGDTGFRAALCIK